MYSHSLQGGPVFYVTYWWFQRGNLERVLKEPQMRHNFLFLPWRSPSDSPGFILPVTGICNFGKDA